MIRSRVVSKIHVSSVQQPDRMHLPQPMNCRTEGPPHRDLKGGHSGSDAPSGRRCLTAQSSVYRRESRQANTPGVLTLGREEEKALDIERMSRCDSKKRL